MSEQTVVVSTQLYENYGEEEQPHWKAKGAGAQYRFNVDPEWWLYADRDEILARICTARSTDRFKVEPMGWQFQREAIDAQLEFEKACQEQQYEEELQRRKFGPAIHPN